jgi:hypothetical protein
VDRIKATASEGEARITALVDELCRVAGNWAYVMRPVLLVNAANGTSHEPSADVARQIRNLGVELHNTQGMLATPDRLTKALSREFSLLPEFAEHVAGDAVYLANAKAALEEAQKNKAEFDQSITYSAEIGGVFTKERLAMSPAGVTWRGHTYKLEEIRRIRWGGTRHSVNGIPTGTTYYIYFGSDAGDAGIELRKSDTFSSIVERLWRAVGVRLLIEYATRLKNGDRVTVGNAIVEDMGVIIPRHRMFKSTEPVRLSWDQVHIWTASGNFVIGQKDDKNVYCTLSYRDTDNTHVLEHMIRMFFKTGRPNVSAILE